MEKEIEQSVFDHRNSIPIVESHYVRTKTNREFIEDSLITVEMHRSYESQRKLLNKPAVNYDAYSCIFNKKFNIGFHVPKKDQCHQCVSYNNSIEDEKIVKKDHYEVHIEETEFSRKDKNEHIENCKGERNLIVAIYDLQAVLPVQIGNSCASFYSSNLN